MMLMLGVVDKQLKCYCLRKCLPLSICTPDLVLVFFFSITTSNSQKKCQVSTASNLEQKRLVKRINYIQGLVVSTVYTL